VVVGSAMLATLVGRWVERAACGASVGAVVDVSVQVVAHLGMSPRNRQPNNKLLNFMQPRPNEDLRLSVPRAQHLNGLLTMLKYYILDTQRCKTIMTLANHEGQKIIRYTIQRCFLQCLIIII
jgi:hypothetical protein